MDKEQEIRLQFLEEAQAYLDTIEAAFLDIATLHHRNSMDAVLRAAHSIKGGAAMMGLEALSDLAHRFEDFFKVLKYSREEVELNTDLEDLMLQGVDALRQIVQQHRRGVTVSPQWLETQVNPVIDQLQDRLGSFHPGDSTLTMVEDEQDMTALLFETEVEASLQRLETLLDTPGQPCLREEVTIMAQELGGLGEMLELAPFIQLCQSVLQHLEAVPDRVEAVARLAVDFWRRSQSLVLAQQKRLLPTRIILPDLEEADIPAFDPRTQTIGGSALAELSAFEDIDLFGWDEYGAPDGAIAEAPGDICLDHGNGDHLTVIPVQDTYVPEPDTVIIHEPEPISSSASVILLGPAADLTDRRIPEPLTTPAAALESPHLAPIDLDSLAFTTGMLDDEGFHQEIMTLGSIPLEDATTIDADFTVAFLESSDWMEDLVDESIRLDEMALDDSILQLDAALDLDVDPTVLASGEALAVPDLPGSLPEVERAIAPIDPDPFPPEPAADLISLIQDSLADLLGPEEASQDRTVVPPTVEVAVEPVAVAEPSGPLRKREPDAGLSGPLTQRERESTPVVEVVASDVQDNTVRVSVRQLDQINDLFGELAIERNGLDLHLGRLRNLVSMLSYRTKALEKSNTRLRTAYDQVAPQAPRGSALSPGGRAPAHSPGSRTGWQPAGSSDHTLPQELRGFRSQFDILEMDRYSDLHSLSQEVMETIVQIQEVTSDIELSLEDTNQTTRDLNRTAKQLQVSLTQVRMRPLSDVLSRFPRALRELCVQYGKKVELKTAGTGTLFDRTVLEALSDPLMHLLRNSFDHGIEPIEVRRDRGKPDIGLIEIRAAHRGNQTTITVSDDGGGIDLAKIRVRALQMGLDMDVVGGASDRELLDLIFEPGFSTATEVTALSGRGVGMDVVRTNLKQVRGEVRVDTQLRRGTMFTITVPFTLSVIRVLLVESQGILMAFPKDAIEEVVLLNPRQVFSTAGNDFLRWEGAAIPLLQLHRWLQFHCPYRTADTEEAPVINQPTVLMVSQGEELRGIRVDRCWGEQEVTVRQVEGTLPLPVGFAGCTILGNGRVVPLVDTPNLLGQMMGVTQLPAPPAALAPEAVLEAAYQLPSAVPVSAQPTILVVDDSIVVRRFLALTLERAGYRVEQAKDGQDALDKLLAGLQVQAIMCDIEMPRLDGYGFLARVKSDPAFHAVPISMLTSRSGEKHRQLAMRLGASAYFSKPYKEQELLQTLKQLIQA